MQGCTNQVGATWVHTCINETLLNLTFEIIFLSCRELLGLRIVTNLLLKTTATIPQVSVCVRVCVYVCVRERYNYREHKIYYYYRIILHNHQRREEELMCTLLTRKYLFLHTLFLLTSSKCMVCVCVVEFIPYTLILVAELCG